MQNALRKKYEENDMDSDNGDLAFVVLDLDLDCNEEKAQRIRELNSEQFSFIVSNPCIEVWFLNHFRYSTKEFLTNDKVIGELKIHVPNYEKSMNMYPVLASKIDFACTTEEQLERNYEGRNWPSIACNPRSDVIKLIPYLRATNP